MAEIQTIEISRDGALWAAILGANLQDGVGGFGKTVADALRDLAGAIERERWEPVDGHLPLVALARNNPG
jgi:hypothetical protein